MTGLKDSAAALHLDTSVALRATLEQGTTPQVENRIAAAPVLVTSRLLLVESARALLWLRVQGKLLGGLGFNLIPTAGPAWG